jgi:hypothetical protein
MLRNRYVIGGVLFLLLATFVYNIIAGWGLITVKVTDAPLAKVIKSIEWQGWVKIYTNLPADTKVSMYVDHVPLAEAMETLAANAGAQWKLGFFAAATSGAVKQEITDFQNGASDDSVKVYSYPTMLQMVTSSQEDAPVADPRRQVWPGKAVADNSISSYLDALAQSADIWIQAPADWSASVASAPSPNSSITGAVNAVVGRAHGSVTTALVLQARRRGFAGGGDRRRGGDMNDDASWNAMEDRVRNAINGLPADSQADALAQLDQETKFRADVKAAPPDQQRQMMRQHFAGRFNGNMDRLSPQKRAARFQRMVAARMAAQGKG